MDLPFQSVRIHGDRVNTGSQELDDKDSHLELQTGSRGSKFLEMARVFKLSKSTAKDMPLLTRPYLISPHSHHHKIRTEVLKYSRQWGISPHSTTNYNEGCSQLYWWKGVASTSCNIIRLAMSGEASRVCSAFSITVACAADGILLEARS